VNRRLSFRGFVGGWFAGRGTFKIACSLDVG
jgi:hypothetical protein